MSSNEVKEVISIEKENEYVRFITKGHRYTDSVGISDIRSYYTALKGRKLEDLEEVANSIMSGTFNIEDFKEKDDTSQQSGLLVIMLTCLKRLWLKQDKQRLWLAL